MFDPVLLAALSGTTFSPRALFAGGEQGAWYDPSDFSTMFQDSAGSTPVTAVEQPVGLIRDKSGRNNHASQATSTSRPVLSARVNLLTYSEQFDNAAWTKTGLGVSANAIAAPDGSTTADKLTEDTSTGIHTVSLGTAVTNGVNYTVSCYAKAAERTWCVLQLQSSCFAYVNLSTGAVGTTTGSPTVTVSNAGNGWYRISVAAKTTAASISSVVYAATADGTVSYTGVSGNGIYIWGADLRVTNDGVGIPAYQRINAATDYDTSGFPLYLAFDGTDDSLSTASIDFSATNKMSVFAGVRKLSDSAQRVVAELTADITLNNGGFLLSAPNSAAANYNFSSKGTTLVDNTVTTYTAPISSVITGQADISGPSNIIRVNGAQVGSVATTQGTGNYANAALNIGRRGGATLPFSGRLYSLIVRGAATNADQLSRTEAWVNSKTSAY